MRHTTRSAVILFATAGCGRAFFDGSASPIDAAPDVPPPIDAPSSLIHQYSFDGTFDDDLGGPALEGLGGTFVPDGYQFNADQGLRLIRVLPQAVYSVEITFAFQRVAQYNKLLDFKKLESDSGLYVENGQLQFVVHPVMDCPNTGDCFTSPTQLFTSSTPTTVTLTRDAAGTFRARVDDQFQFVFPDTEASATFDGPDAIGHLFVDDNNTLGNEASSGIVRRVRIYSAPI